MDNLILPQMEWLKTWARHYYNSSAMPPGGPIMIGSTWDIDDARASFRDEAASFGDQLFQIAVDRIETGKSKRLKNDNAYYWHHSISALVEYLEIRPGTPRLDKAPPITEAQMAEALTWVFKKFWPRKGVDIWLDEEFESFIESDPSDW